MAGVRGRMYIRGWRSESALRVKTGGGPTREGPVRLALQAGKGAGWA